jgi:hypothetical protein
MNFHTKLWACEINTPLIASPYLELSDLTNQRIPLILEIELVINNSRQSKQVDLLAVLHP